MARDEDDEYSVPDGDDVIPDYDPNSTYFTMKLWHSGQVVIYEGTTTYVGGSFEYVDHCDYDRMSILELDGIVSDKLKFSVGAIYYMKVPGVQDLQLVENDAWLIKSLDRTLLITRLVELYCSHPINEPVLSNTNVEPEASKKNGTHAGPESEGIGSLGWHVEENVDNHSQEEGVNHSQEEGVNEDFRDSDYEQSDEEEVVDPAVEKNLEGLVRRNKGKGIEIDTEAGFVVEDSDSDTDQEYGTRKVVQSLDSDEDESVQLPDDEASTSKRTNRAKKKLPKLPEFIPASDLKNPTFQLGLLFPNADSFRKAIRAYALNAGKDIYFKRNESGRIRACCSKKAGNCAWTCFASKVSGSTDFMVKTFIDVHNCVRKTSNRFATAAWLASVYADQLKSRKGWDVHEFINQVKRDHVIEIDIQKAYLARKIAEGKIERTYKEQFNALWDYAEEIKFTNPGSTVKLKTLLGDDGIPQFERIYICYAACKAGFKAGCRKVVGLDGCHLKGPHKGQLLSAIAIDANNSMFPVSFAVVEVECKDSWGWFLDLLREDLEINNSHHWSFISDKQKGLEQALKDLWHSEEEQAEHRHCARHVQANFTTHFKGLNLKLKMMAAAYATTVPQFKIEMEEIKKDNVKAYDWLMSKGPNHWCRAFFKTTPKCDILLNNICESFNGTTAILTARERPILSLLERIRMYILQRHTKQRLAISKWNLSIGPRISKILERGKIEAAYNVAYWCGAGTYQVIDNQGSPYSVELENKTCSCRKWDLSGIPCSHAIACIWHNHEDPETYVHEHYKKDAYERTYAHHMLPPAYKKQPGRPKRARRLEPEEVFTAGQTKMRRAYNTNHCKSCGMNGHNSRTCHTRQSSSQARQARQRPQHGRWKSVSHAMPTSRQDDASTTQVISPTKIKERARRRAAQRNKKSQASRKNIMGSQGTQTSQVTQDN